MAMNALKKAKKVEDKKSTENSIQSSEGPY